jgi:hypothetical protein
MLQRSFWEFLIDFRLSLVINTLMRGWRGLWPPKIGIFIEPSKKIENVSEKILDSPRVFLKLCWGRFSPYGWLGWPRVRDVAKGVWTWHKKIEGTLLDTLLTREPLVAVAQILRRLDEYGRVSRVALETGLCFSNLKKLDNTTKWPPFPKINTKDTTIHNPWCIKSQLQRITQLYQSQCCHRCVQRRWSMHWNPRKLDIYPFDKYVEQDIINIT